MQNKYSLFKHLLICFLFIGIWSSFIGFIVIYENKVHNEMLTLLKVELKETITKNETIVATKLLPEKINKIFQKNNAREINSFMTIWWFGLIIGGITYIIIAYQITKRKKAQKEVLSSKEKYQKLSSIGFEGIFIHKNGKVIDFNEAVVRMLGYSKTELHERPLIDIIIDEAKRKEVLELMKLDYAAPYEVTVKRKDGSPLIVEVESREIKSENSTIRVSAMRDISRRKAAEESLILKNHELESAEEEIRASNEELVATNEALKENMHELESAEEEVRAGLEELQIKNGILSETQTELQALTEHLQLIINNIPIRIFWKDKFANYLGCNELFAKDANLSSAKEIIGKTPIEVYGTEMGERYNEEDWEVIKSKKSIINRTEIEEQKGIKKYFRTSRIPLFNKNKEVIGLLGTYENITEVTNIQEELVRSKEKAVESDRLKSAFLANMSHEIRTPMNAIIGFSQLLNLGNNPDPKQKEFIEIIQNAGDQLLSLIDNILDISKIETGQVLIQKNDVDINELLKQMESTFSLKAANNNNQLKLYIESNDFDGIVKTDKTRLRQLLSNLLTNALKFTHDGIVEFGYTLAGTDIQFFVRDTGCGIPQQELEKIFDRFHQTTNQTQIENNGVGLGLSICKGIVQLLNGHIWVDSVENKGSIFHFSIPAKNELLQSSSNAASYKLTMSNMTILIAEDNPINLKVIEALLQPFKTEILHAANGQKALEVYEKNPQIDLVLMDIKMPEINGHEVALILKKENPSLPIIAQTVFSFTEQKEEFMDSRFDAYLTKPLKKDIFLNTIIEVMERKKASLN